MIAQRPEVLTASAANTSLARLLASVAMEIQAQDQTRTPSASVTVTDVVPLSADDPNGASLTTLAFPIVFGGMIGGILISLLVVGVLRRLLALLVYGAAAGLLVGFVAQTWFGVLSGDFVVNAVALALATLATASVVVGFTALLGTPGFARGAVITILIGNPIAGATMPYQFLARPWGEIGQYFVPGAGSTLIRSLSYFPDADSGTQWLVLGAWAVGGLMLSVIGNYRGRAEIPLPAAEPEATSARGAAPAGLA